MSEIKSIPIPIKMKYSKSWHAFSDPYNQIQNYLFELNVIMNDDGFLLTPSEIWKNGLFVTPSKIMEMGLLTPSKIIERFDLFGSFASFAACFVGLVAIFDPKY